VSNALERINQQITTYRDVLTVARVYGEPVEHDGIVVIPAAAVRGGGGGGGGGGTDVNGQVGEGGGSGFGVNARPVGAFVIRDGEVRWEPVEDPLGRLMTITMTATIGMFVLRSMVRRRRRRRR